MRRSALGLLASLFGISVYGALTVNVALGPSNLVDTANRTGAGSGGSQSVWTLASTGDASGDVNETDAGATLSFSATGSSEVTDDLDLAYQTQATDSDMQLCFRVASIAGYTENFTSGGGTFREGITGDEYQALWQMPNIGQTRAKTIASGTQTSVAVGNIAYGTGTYGCLTYDDSLTDIRWWESSDGMTYSQIAQVSKSLTFPVYPALYANAHEPNQTSFIVVDNAAYATTIDVYTPGSAPGVNDPVWDTTIENQSWVEDSAISSIDVSSYCSITQGSGPTFSGAGLPTGISISSGGVISGTPTTVSTGNATITCNDGIATTDDIFAWSITTAPGSGTNYNIATGTSTANCSTLGVVAGDTITLLGTARGRITFANCFGTAGSRITIRNDVTESSPLTISSGGNVLICDNCEYVTIDGTGKWVGAGSDACGMSDWPNIPATPQCGIVLNATGSNGQMLKSFGSTRWTTWKGIEVDGNGISGAAISCNDQSYTRADHPGEWREGLIYEDLYVHDAGTEAVYCGANWEAGGVERPDLRLRDNEVRYNYVVNAGYDAISFKSCISDELPCKIHHNIVSGAGTTQAPPSTGNSGACIGFYEGAGVIYNNYVEDCFGHGIQTNVVNIPNTYDLDFIAYNNIVVRAGTGNTANKSGISPNRSGGASAAFIRAEIYNNTAVNSNDAGMRCGSNVTGFIRDNIAADGGISASGCSNINNLTGTVASVSFVNSAADNYHINPGSPAVNNGTANCPASDFDDETRTGTCDQGADQP